MSRTLTGPPEECCTALGPTVRPSVRSETTRSAANGNRVASHSLGDRYVANHDADFRCVFRQAVGFQEYSPAQDSCYKFRDRWISGPPAPPAMCIFLVSCDFRPTNVGFARQMGTFFEQSEPPECRWAGWRAQCVDFSPIALSVVRFLDCHEAQCAGHHARLSA